MVRVGKLSKRLLVNGDTGFCQRSFKVAAAPTPFVEEMPEPRIDFTHRHIPHDCLVAMAMHEA